MTATKWVCGAIWKPSPITSSLYSLGSNAKENAESSWANFPNIHFIETMSLARVLRTKKMQPYKKKNSKGTSNLPKTTSMCTVQRPVSHVLHWSSRLVTSKGFITSVVITWSSCAAMNDFKTIAEYQKSHRRSTLTIYSFWVNALTSACLPPMIFCSRIGVFICLHRNSQTTFNVEHKWFK